MDIFTTQDVGEAVRTARKALGLTQPELAMAAGVGVRFVVDLEAGKSTLRMGLVLAVIDVLGGQLKVMGLPTESSAADEQ